MTIYKCVECGYLSASWQDNKEHESPAYGHRMVLWDISGLPEFLESNEPAVFCACKHHESKHDHSKNTIPDMYRNNRCTNCTECYA